MSLPITLLVVAALLVLVSLVQRLAVRSALPASVLLATAGILIGGAALAIVVFDAGGTLANVATAIVSLPVDSEVFLYIFLPLLLFQSALTIEVQQMVEDAGPILVLAVVAVVIATLTIGGALAPVAGVPAVACLMLGAIVATTDPVAVIGIFRDVGAPSRLTRLVEGESLLNDAAAITLFTVLLDMLVGHGEASVSAAVVTFIRTFLGGIVVGFLGARVMLVLLSYLRDLRLAQVTLTLALPYVVYIVGDHMLGVSGVVAAVTSGLVLSGLGPQKIAPADWQFLQDLWEQLAFWASSLIFLLASLLVPKLLIDVGWRDALSLLVLVVAALAGRAVVLYGVIPLLSAVRLGQRVDSRFNAVILWGGLRGAVTLALALAVTENHAITHDVQRFIAVLATGFVLFTLLVQGLTLRPLIRMLGLDRLTPFDQALRAHVLTLSRRRVADAVVTTGREYHFPDELVQSVAGAYHQSDGVTVATPIVVDAGNPLGLGLVALAHREREIVLEHFASRTISGRVVEDLLADVGLLIDETKGAGRDAYLEAAQAAVRFNWKFRAAQLVHRRFRVDAWLVDRLADRFERLLALRIILDELDPYIDDKLVGLVGESHAPILHDLLRQRQQMTDAAVEAMRAQYPQYAQLLEQRFLRRIALRREDVEYRALFDEHVIGPEIYNTLGRELRASRTEVEVRPHFDLGLETRALIAHVPLFAGLTAGQLDSVARLLQPRIAVPDERLISTGDRGDAMYFISSGVVEVNAAGGTFLLTRGDFFGEMALILDQPRQADVTARSYCQLLALASKDFQALLRSSREIRAQIDKAAAERARLNAAGTQ
jgi:CPA1 family monovalent cation:H+ antiporter